MNHLKVGLIALGCMTMSATITRSNATGTVPMSAVPGPRKHALVVAVASYSKVKTGWKPLNTAKDTVLIREALITQGFLPGDIHVVFDGDKRAIMRAIDSLLVDNKKVERNDVVFFHFSGHGQQIQDQDGDEEDGYDEAIVPIDAPIGPSHRKNYDGSAHIRDDELNERFSKVRAKLGPKGSMLMVIDACHSGTMSRGDDGEDEHARGTPLKWEFSSAITDRKGRSAHNERENYGLAGDDPRSAPLFCFFGSSQFELNYEYQAAGCGSATFAFSKAFAGAREGTSYRQLFEEVKWEMETTCKVKNKPQFEGDPDRAVLSNAILGRPLYFSVREVRDPGHVVVQAGRFEMVEEGTRMKFYPADTRDTASVAPLAEGTVRSNNLSASYVELLKPMADSTLLARSWVYPSGDRVGRQVAKVRFEGNYNTLFELQVRYHDSRFVRFVEEHQEGNILVKEAYRRQGKDSTRYYLVRTAVEQPSDTCKTDEELFGRLETAGRGLYLRSLAQGEGVMADSSVDLRIFTVARKKELDKMFFLAAGRLADGHSCRDGLVRLFSTDTVDIQLLDKRAARSLPPVRYYAILELNPKYGIRTIKPRFDKHYRKYLWNECQLGLRDRTIPGFAPTLMSPPYGRYSVILFISDEPFNTEHFEQLYTPQGIDRYIQSVMRKTRGDDFDQGNESMALPNGLRVFELQYEYVK